MADPYRTPSDHEIAIKLDGLSRDVASVRDALRAHRDTVAKLIEQGVEPRAPLDMERVFGWAAFIVVGYLAAMGCAWVTILVWRAL